MHKIQYQGEAGSRYGRGGCGNIEGFKALSHEVKAPYEMHWKYLELSKSFSNDPVN